MRRKGDLSINMIIVAAIALLVLVIIAALIIRQYGKVSTVTEKCAGGIGTCSDTGECGEGYQSVRDPTCRSGYCCIPKPTPEAS
ncbi:hypothetical protein J7K74_01040 [Candidatus Woesearchaeota archaeon]|nr:hypothetical protein [Candidatus Woesearchaeota archaeon]